MKLQIKDGTGETKSIVLGQDEITIGRDASNTLPLKARNVSRRHARLIRNGDSFTFEDLSRYGSWINEIRVRGSQNFSTGDALKIGDFELSFGAASAVKARGAVAPAPSQDLSDFESTQLVDGRALNIQEAQGKKRIVASRPTLVVLNTPMAGRELELTKSSMVAGRTSDNDIAIDHSSISRRHAKFALRDGQVRVKDMDSKNGLKVNGEFWDEATLRDGDTIELGTVRMHFVDAGQEFLYIPGTYDHIDTEDERRKGGFPLWAVFALLLLAGAAFYLIFQGGNKPESLSNVAVSPEEIAEAAANRPAEEAPADTDKGEADQAEAAAAPAEDPAAEDPKDDPEAEQKAMLAARLHDRAKEAMDAKQWDQAETFLNEMLSLKADDAEGQKLLALATSEKNVQASFKEAQALQKKGDLKAAWGVLSGPLAEAPKDSHYNKEIVELRTAVSGSLANDHVDSAQRALNQKDWDKAVSEAKAAKRYVPNNAKAERIQREAEGALSRQAQRDAKAKREAEAKREASGQPAAPAKAASGDDKLKELSTYQLYSEAQSLHSTNPSEALKRYQIAASRGYPQAYRQIGNIMASQGKRSDAIYAFEKYLSLAPAANDASDIRERIQRLKGGR